MDTATAEPPTAATPLAEMERNGVINASEDPLVRAVFLLVNDLAVVVLRDLISNAVGVDPLSRAGLERWGSNVMQIYTRGLYVTAPTDIDPPIRPPAMAPEPDREE